MILTNSEFTERKNNLNAKFNDAWFADMQQKIWMGSRNGVSKTRAKLLWLFKFTVDNYDHSITETNYVTEKQVMTIFSKTDTI